MIVYPERIKDLPEQSSGFMKPCMKKPITIKAAQIQIEFQVEALEGNYKQGKAGDYLMSGIDGELYICDKSIFERTYDWV